MTSSTSSSDRRLGGRPARRCAALFAVTFLAVAAGTEALARSLPALRYTHPGPTAAELPAGDWYLDHGLGVNSYSHTLALYGLGPTIENARGADLVFLGSSRTLFAFPPEVVGELAARHGLRAYNLGFGFGETSVWARRLLERHDLRPRMAVINVDWFFVNGASEFAKANFPEGGFAMLRGSIEALGEYAYRRFLRPYLPHFAPTIPLPLEKWEGPGAFAMMRSTEHGGWLAWNPPPRRIAVDPAGGQAEVPGWQVPIAREFCDWLRSRGTEPVFTHAPSSQPFNSRASVEALAEELGVTFVAPELEGLSTMDRSHLDPESGARFARAFAAELEATDVFQELFGDGRGGS